MGIFRGGLLVIFSVLFFLCLIVQGFFLTVYFSLDYNTVNPQLSSVASGILEKQGIQEKLLENKPMMELYCQNNSEFVFSEPTTNQVFTIPCEDILGDSDVLIKKQISKRVEENYYKSYDCNFFDCVQKTQDPFSLVSKHAQEYWKNKFFSFLIVCLVLVGIIFVLVEHKSNFFLLLSALFAAASFMFFKLDIFAGWILKPFFSIQERLGDLSFSSILEMLSVFLSKSPLIFTWFFGIAILLLGIGLIFKIFGIGFEISALVEKVEKLFKKDSETSVPAEAKKEEKVSSGENKKSSNKKSK